MVDRRRRVIKVQSVVCSLEESTFDKKRETTKKRARGERRALLGGRPQRWRDARRANAGNTSDFWTTRKEVAKDSSSLRRLCDDDDAIQKHPEFVTKPPLKMNSIERDDTNNNNNNNERTHQHRASANRTRHDDASRLSSQRTRTTLLLRPSSCDFFSRVCPEKGGVFNLNCLGY